MTAEAAGPRSIPSPVPDPQAAQFTVFSGDERTWLVRILIVTGIIYCYSLRNEFVFDDDEMIVGNRYLGNWRFVWNSLIHDSRWFLNPSHLPAGPYYRPLQDIWLALNFSLFGLHPEGWRAAEIALHLAVIVMVYRVAARLFGNPQSGLFAAGLFALMPVHAECAIWPAAVSQPLSAVLELAAFELYLTGSRRNLAPGLISFSCAMLAYEGAVTLPVLIATHAFLFAPEGDDTASSSRTLHAIVAAWPYALVTAGFIGLRYRVLGIFSTPNPLNAPGAFETALTIPRMLASYLATLVLPWRTGPAHPLAVVESIASPEFLFPVFGLLALGAAGWLALRNYPQRKSYLFCTLWIVIALAPAFDLHSLGIQSAIQDRYLYLPSFGFCAFAGDFAARFAQQSRERAIATGIAATVIAAVLAVMLIVVQSYWRNELRLFARAINQFPGAALWHNRMGMALKARGDFAGARREFDSAVKLDPNDAASIYDLGLVDMRLGDPRTAEGEIARAIDRFTYRQPAEYAQLAFAADAAGDRSRTDAALADAAMLPNGAAIAALARAQLRFRHGDSAGAGAAMEGILIHPPRDAETLIAVGAELSSERRYREALFPYQAAASITPHDPALHVRIADSLRRIGRNREALRECSLALADAPNDAGALALKSVIERTGAQ
ncbi:MAG TPA: tetratricopeptide repeat protein [Candidatus Binataceae bacterium]|nr:tetratricopeptide repeat protein [Candidatus Binataceae bacterium]